ncbi:MAG: ComF family protein [Pyrinomonadaceae bacterium]
MEFQSPVFSAVGSLFSVIQDSLLTLLYPQACKICEKSVEFKADGFVCGECWQNTRIFKPRSIICRKCSAFLTDGLTDSDVFCRACETDEYDLAHSVGLYEKALAVAVLSLKIHPFIPLRLQKLIRDSFVSAPFQNIDLIIPVPLSERRLRERGFNQAAVIAKIIGGRNGELAIDENSLKRTIHTERHRAGMDKKSRFEIVQNVFEVKRPRLIKGKNILLVDDVFTSGATVSNCAKILKKSGTNKVYVLTIARAF